MDSAEGGTWNSSLIQVQIKDYVNTIPVTVQIRRDDTKGIQLPQLTIPTESNDNGPLIELVADKGAGESQYESAEHRRYYDRGYRDRNRRYFTANPFPAPTRTKRKFSGGYGRDDGYSDTKRMKTLGAGKTPSGLLNELFLGLVYQYSNQIGLPHEPLFQVSVTIPPDKKYEGSGRSKKLAKQNLAEKIMVDMGYSLATTESPMDTDIPQEEKVVTTPPQIKQEPEEEDESINTCQSSMSTPASQLAHRVPVEPVDFTSDDLADLAVSGNPTALQQALIPCFAPVHFVNQKTLKKLTKLNVDDHPCCALNTVLEPGDEINYEFLPTSDQYPPHQMRFVVKLSCTIRSFAATKQMDFQKQVFIGEAQTKKQAKANAARLALNAILGPECFNYLAAQNKNLEIAAKVKTAIVSKRPITFPSPPSPALEMENSLESGEYSIQFSQQVKKLITEKHAELILNDDVYSSQKVLAGVVMTLGSPLVDNMHVVAVTTGTKCINGDFMSDEGRALNDCHAEILATRCLRDFLYSQIDVLVSVSQDSTIDAEKKQEMLDGVIVVEQPSYAEGMLRFAFQPGVKFHLYISTSPCGDARIFSPKALGVSPEEELMEAPSTCAPGEGAMDSHPNRMNRGVLRAKIEAGEGTIPVSNLADEGIIQTWDGIMLGNAVRTMSCSDKICKWNVVGMQGALLSVFMDPIYYESITIGSLHHPVHLKRALFARIESLSPLPPPYMLNKPKLIMVADKSKRRVVKSPNHSVIWTCSWNSHEIVSSARGRCEPAGVTSRLCKRQAFMRFLKLYENETGNMDNYAKISYGNAKKLAKNYQTSKVQFIQFMKDNGYGAWISKPLETDDFYIY